MKRLCFTAFLIAIALSYATPGAGSPPTGEAVIARWDGGTLSAERFQEIYDSSERARRTGGVELHRAVLRAAVLEIYSDLGRRQGLDETPEYQRRVKDWETRRLAALYRRYYEPDTPSTTEDRAVEEYYERHRRDLFRREGSVDFQSVFLRCSEAPAARVRCRERFDALRRRIPESGDLAPLIAELKPTNGEANGVFRDIPPSSLAPDLAAAIDATPVGEPSPIVETPIGLFLVRVFHRTAPEILPLASVRDRIIADLAGEARKAWLDGIVEEMQTVEDALARAAALAGLDRNEDFVRRRELMTTRELAVEALQRDRRMIPDDDDLRTLLRDDPALLEPSIRRHLFLATVDAGKDRYEAFRTVESVRSLLDAADDPFEAFLGLPDVVSGIRLEDLGFLSMREIEGLHPDFPGEVRGMGDGEWRGPIVLSPSTQRVHMDSTGHSTVDRLPVGFAFLLLERTSRPSFELIRDDVARSVAEKLLADPEPVEDRLREIRGLEIAADPYGVVNVSPASCRRR